VAMQVGDQPATNGGAIQPAEKPHQFVVGSDDERTANLR
jgi:hypothetical protein